MLTLLKIIVDTSTLISLERVDLIKLLNKVDYKIIIPKAVEKEIRFTYKLKNIEVVELVGRSLKKSNDLEKLGIDKGEAQCCVLAKKLRLKFIICDDRKFIRQRFFLDKQFNGINIVGFSFFLHIFYRRNLIKDVWSYFNKIINLNHWERSEVQIVNYIFLKELGY